MKRIETENKIMKLIILTLFLVVITYFYKSQLISEWDTYSEVLPIGKMIQMQCDSIAPGNFMGIYTEHWGDEENYSIFLEANDTVAADFKSYTDQIGLHGTVFGIINKFLYTFHFNAEMRLRAIYFINVIFSCFMVAILLYGIYDRFGGGACIGVLVILLPFPVFFRALHNLYWCFGAKMFPAATSTLIALKCAKTKRWNKRYYFYIFFAMLLCLCNTFEYVTMEMVMSMIPLLILWIDNDVEFFKHLFVSSALCICAFFTSIIIWFIQCTFYYESISDALWHMWMIVGSRGGLNAINDDPMSNLGRDLSVWDVISRFLYGEKAYIIGSIKIIHIILLLSIILLCCYFIRFLFHNITIDVGMLFFILTSLFSSVSWMMISQGHAYFHAHLTIVLWFFCFIPALGCWCGKNIQIVLGIIKEKI